MLFYSNHWSMPSLCPFLSFFFFNQISLIDCFCYGMLFWLCGSTIQIPPPVYRAEWPSQCHHHVWQLFFPKLTPETIDVRLVGQYRETMPSLQIWGPAIRSLQSCVFSRLNKPQCHSLSLQGKCSNPWPFLWHFAELPPADHYLSCYWCSLNWTKCLDVVSGGWVEGNNHTPGCAPVTIALDALSKGHTLRAHVQLSAHKSTSSPEEQRDCFKGLFLPGAGLYICPCWIL